VQEPETLHKKLFICMHRLSRNDEGSEGMVLLGSHPRTPIDEAEYITLCKLFFVQLTYNNII
jgi:hypothetical protein